MPPVKLFKAGKMDQEILSIILSNIRIADQRIGDIKAQAAALTVGERRFTALLDRYGKETVSACIVELRARGTAGWTPTCRSRDRCPACESACRS